jgi:hypothetical protein
VFLATPSRAGAALAVAWVALAGCTSEKGCIDMECSPPTLEILFEPTITQAGRYRFSHDADGATSSCEIDFRPDGPGWSGASSCNYLILRGGLSRDLANEIMGYALPQAARASLAAFRDGQPWAEGSFEPVYRAVELHGEGCGECIVAREVLPLP